MEEGFDAPFAVPNDVEENIPVPDNHNPVNRDLGVVYKSTAEYVNIAFGYIKDQYEMGSSNDSYKALIEVTKTSIEGCMNQIHEILQGPHQSSFPVPDDLLEAFGYLGLVWPPVEAQDQEN